MQLPPLPAKPSHIAIIAAACALLAGCATFSPDGGMNAVSTMTKERTGQALSPATHAQPVLAELLAKPLTADGAVLQIALLNNKGLHVSLAELGVAEADLVQAGRMRNQGFHFSRLRGGDDVEIERGILFDLSSLLTIPMRSGIEQRRFEQAKLQAASQAVRLAAETRKAYFNAITAQQMATYAEQVNTAAQASAELAQRMARVGNWSKLDQAKEQMFYAEAIAYVARTRHNAIAAREQLTRLMGLWSDNIAYRLPERLPDQPPAPNDIIDLEAQAMRQRLDIQMARHDVEATANALGLTKATGFINVLDAGYINKSETGNPRSNGYAISLEVPIFDWSGARVAKAESLYMQAVHRTADIALRARSEVREAYSAYRTNYDLAKHYRNEIVPLRKKISDEVLLRYNGMLIGVFELLADAREQIDSVNAAIEAQRDYWLAETDLQMAINGSSITVASLRGKPAAAEARQEH